MNPKMLYECIMQNVEMMDGLGDIKFELYQLGKLCHQDYSKESKLLNNPNIMGKPKQMKKLEQMITEKFRKRPIKIQKYPKRIRHRKTDIAAPVNQRKGYAKARHIDK